MDLRDLRCDDQPRDLEQFVGGDVSIADRYRWTRGIAQPAVGIGRKRGLLAERADEGIVLAREKVVIEAQAHRPVVGKRRGFLSGPLWIHRVGRGEQGKITALLVCPPAIRSLEL